MKSRDRQIKKEEMIHQPLENPGYGEEPYFVI